MLFLLAFSAQAAALDTACQEGDGAACHRLATRALAATPPDGKTAVAALEKGCSVDYADACVALGLVLAEGRVVAADTARASKLLSTHCDSGVASACRGLGTLILASKPSAKESKRGAGLLEDACNADDWPACAYLGDWALENLPPPSHLITAMKYYTLACTGNVDYGCTRIEALGH